MLNKLKPKSEFSRNVLTLMTGTTIAQAIPIAISPILTRLYTPEDFGVFAMFVAIVSIFGSISNGRYELAIMLPKKDEDAINIMALGLIMNFSLTLFLLFIVIVFHEELLSLLNNEDMSSWLYLVPFSVFLIGCFNLLTYFNNRKKYYKDLAKAKVYKSIGMAIVQLGLAFLKLGAMGLVSGQIFSLLISNTKLFFNIKRLDLFKKIKLVKIIILSKKYINFLKYSTLNVLVDNLRSHGFNVLISFYFSIVTLGQYYLAQKVLQIPVVVVGSSLSQVFLKKISEAHEKELYILSIKLIRKIIIISLPMFILINLFAVDIFSFVFGDKWQVAGKIVSILTPWMFLSFLTSPLSNIFIVLQKQGVVLIYGIFYAVVPLIVIFLINDDFILMLKLLSLLMSFVLIIFLIHIIYMLRRINNVV